MPINLAKTKCYIISCLLVFTVLGSEVAFAQSNACIQLERRLASVSTGNSNRKSRKYQQYDRAVRDQSVQIRKTKRIALRNGCNVNLRVQFGRCGRYVSSLRKMRQNLAELKRVRSQLGSGGGNASAERRAILRQMKRRNCGRQDVRVAKRSTTERKRRSLIEQIFGVRTYGENGRNDGVDFSPLGRGGTFRTMCVRTCDGYYFPISFSTISEQFPTDAQACQNMCPGSETELYYHAMPSQSPEQMISYRTDRPYAEEPFAFNYRKSVNAECKCDFKQAGLEELAGSQTQSEEDVIVERDKPVGFISLPNYRTDPFSDVETLLNGAGGLTIAAAQSIQQSTAIAEDGSDDPLKKRKIRIVGPAFFPSQ